MTTRVRTFEGLTGTDCFYRDATVSDKDVRSQLADPLARVAPRELPALEGPREDMFTLDYNLALEVDEHKLEAFAEANGMVNAFPYWRQLVQIVLPSMGVHKLKVPVLRFPSLWMTRSAST